MLSPYYDITTEMKGRYGFLEQEIAESFTRRSFMIRPLIDLLVRQGKRTELEHYWREITYIAQQEFIPAENWMHFLWRSRKGRDKSEFTKQTQSWKELTDEANRIDLDSIPITIQTHPYFLPFFLLVYPHRVTANYAKFLDNRSSQRGSPDESRIYS